MTATTSRGYLYPTGTDRPCDLAQHFSAMALDIDDDMRVLWDEVTRLDDIPFVALANMQIQRITAAGPIVSYTLTLDDQYGMSNLDADARQVVIPDLYPGTYMVNFWAQVLTPAINAYSFVGCQVGGEPAFQGMQVNAAGFEYLSFAYPITFTAPPFSVDPIYIQMEWDGPTQYLDLGACNLWVYWLRDI